MFQNYIPTDHPQAWGQSTQSIFEKVLYLKIFTDCPYISSETCYSNQNIITMRILCLKHAWCMTKAHFANILCIINGSIKVGYGHVNIIQPWDYQVSKCIVHEIKFGDSCHVNINNLPYCDSMYILICSLRCLKE